MSTRSLKGAKRASLNPLPKRKPDDAFQQIGDVTLYTCGSVYFPNRVFEYGTAIDDWKFSEGFIARRRIDYPEVLLVESPGGEETVLFFNSKDRLWSHIVPMNDFRFEKCAATYGPKVAAFWWRPGLYRRIFWLLFPAAVILAIWARELLPQVLFMGFLMWFFKGTIPKRIYLP